MGCGGAAGPRVRDARCADAGLWNDFLVGQADPSPLARFEWRRVLADTYGVETNFYMAERDDRLVGVLPTYVTRGLRGSRALYSLRHGLRAQHPDAADRLLQCVATQVRAGDVGRASITSGFHPATDRWPAECRTTVVLRLGDDEEETWRGLRDKTRNMIRKAERSGLSLAVGADYADVLYRQYRDNMLRLGVQLHCRAFFGNILKAFAGDAQVLVANYEGRPIASMLLLFLANGACYPFQSALYEHRRLAPVQFLNWQAMRLCLQRGVTSLDMGESSRGSPVYRSKTNFGGTPLPVHYYAPGVEPEAGAAEAGAPGQEPAESWKRRGERYLRQRSPGWIREQYALWRLRHGRII